MDQKNRPPDPLIHYPVSISRMRPVGTSTFGRVISRTPFLNLAVASSKQSGYPEKGWANSSF
jgi:hypothetical protein